MPIEAGEQLLHYRLIEKIGEGGMGIVWKAEDTRLDREVALKILPDALARDRSRLARFEREAKAVAALNHPNIVTLHAIEQDGDVRFITMELVRGKSLREHVPSGGLGIERLLEIAGPLVDAVAKAHAGRITHRDLKPDNVMIDEDGRIKILDFGLAKVTGAPEADGATDAPTATSTGAGVVLGTACYMSPEQAQGKPADERSDIFSLGVMLYEMATGERPFKGDNPMSILSSIIKDPAPSLIDAKPVHPRQLGRIVARCLEKDPERRFQKARSVGTELENLAREVGVSRPAGAASAPRRWLPAAGVLVLTAAAVAVVLLQRDGAGESPGAPVPGTVPKIVVLPFDNLGRPDDQYFADGMTEEITSRLATLDGIGVISRTSALQYKDARPAATRIGEELGVDYILEGTVRWQRADDGSSRVRVTPTLIRVAQDTSIWTERYDEVLADIFEVQSDIARRVSESLGVALLEPQKRSLEARPTDNLEAYDVYLRANEYYLRGVEIISVDAIRLAIPMYEEAVRLDPDFALAQAKLAVAHLTVDTLHRDSLLPANRAAAASAIERALELDPELPEAHLARGALHEAEGELALALNAYERARDGRPNSSEIHAAIGAIQARLGQWEESLANMARATELNPRVGHLPCSTGGVCLAMRRYDDALSYHRDAIRLTPDRACPYYCEAFIFLNADGDTSRVRRALTAIPEGVPLEDQPPINYPWVIADLFDAKYEDALERLVSGPSQTYEFWDFLMPKALLSGQIHDLLGRADEAAEHYETARELLEARVAENPDDPRLRGPLGVTYAALGLREEAMREGEWALRMIRQENQQALGWRLQSLARIYMLLGEHETAIDHLAELLSKPTSTSAQFIDADPTWQPLRDEPRFRELLKRHGA